jgi:hypothetical protein
MKNRAGFLALSPKEGKHSLPPAGEGLGMGERF